MKLSGAIGWFGLTAYVIAWDYCVEDSLTAAFARSVRHPIRRWPVTLAWSLTTLHLFGRLPERYDPFRGLGRRVRTRYS